MPPVVYCLFVLFGFFLFVCCYLFGVVVFYCFCFYFDLLGLHTIIKPCKPK